MQTAPLFASMSSDQSAGFADPVMDAQAVFRAVMMALAEPGIVRPLDAHVLAVLDAPAPLTAASAAILLALADYETSVWLDPALSTAEITGYLRFHTGCPIVSDRGMASFAVVADDADLPDLGGFAIGTLEYPDRSTTLIIQIASLTDGPAWAFSGPGIATTREVRLSSVHPAFVEAIQANRALFPCGVDLIFTDGSAVLGLPRSTVIMEA